MSRYLIIYQSESIQDASREFPRIIVFGKNASTVITFNGEKEQVSSSAIEAFHFNRQGYEFREFEFTAEPGFKEHPDYERDLEFSTDKIRISVANPAKCKLCHGENHPHPIWDEYPLWPGAVGSEDDFGYAGDSLGRLFVSAPGAIDEERQVLSNFLKLRQSSNRYSSLQTMSLPKLEGRLRPNLEFSVLMTSQAVFLMGRELRNRGVSADRFLSAEKKCDRNLSDAQLFAYQLDRLKRMKKNFGNALDQRYLRLSYSLNSKSPT